LTKTRYCDTIEKNFKYIKEKMIMLNTLMLIAANIPQTGDTFPRGVIFIIIIAAVVLAFGTAVFAKKKGGNDDDEDDDE
jgi:hypothetical protein